MSVAGGRTWLLGLAAAAWLGCGAAVEPLSGDAAGTGTDAHAGTCAMSVMCPAATVPVQKACTVDSDCTVVRHVANCCGGTEAIGVRFDSVASFPSADRPCVAAALCDCASANSVEDGSGDSPTTPVVAVCRGGCCFATH